MDDLRNAPLAKTDPLISEAIDNEVARQANGLELIASENFVSEAVLEAAGSVFTNKYAEGYPKKRYYGGCEWADVVEQTAIDRLKQLFGAEHANVQPHSTKWRIMASLAKLNRSTTMNCSESPRNTAPSYWSVGHQRIRASSILSGLAR